MPASGLVWPLKWVGQSVRSNRMHRQALDGRPQKILAFWRWNPNHPKMVYYSTRKSSKWGVCPLWGSFDLQNGSDGPWGPTGCIDKVLTDVHKKIGIFDVGIRITRKMVCYSKRKSSKWGVCSLWGSFDLPNGSDKPWWPTVCIDKVLTDVHKKFGIFDVGIRITQKMVSYSTRKSSKWGVC